MNETHIPYDITAVSPHGERIPLTAGTSYSMAHEIAKPRSKDSAWSSVEIRETGTGELVSIYADGIIISGSTR